MNSLSDLNSYAQTSLTYVDDRNPVVNFDRSIPLNFNIDTGDGQDHFLPLGIDITEIVKPDVVNVYFEIDVSSVTDAFVTWETLPSGVIFSNPSTGIYRISNIDTKEQWDAVKDPSIQILSGTPDYNYTAAIHYEPSKNKTWGISVKITVLSNLTSTTSLSASPTFFAKNYADLSASASLSVLPGKRKDAVFDGTVAFTLIALGADLDYAYSNLQTIISMSASSKVLYGMQSNLSAIASQTVSYSRLRTPNANLNSIASINSYIGNYSYAITQTSSPTDYDWVYGNIINSFITTDYKIAGVSGAPLNGAGIYTRSGGSWVLQQNLPYTLPSGVPSDYYGFGSSVSIDSTGTYAVVASQNQYSGIPDIYFYARSGTTWTQTSKFTNSAYYGFPEVFMSKDGSYTVLTNGFADDVYVFVRSGTTWTQESVISRNLSTNTNRPRLNSDATVLAFQDINSTTLEGIVKIYTRSGTTWSLQSSISAPESGVIDFGRAISITNDGLGLIISAKQNSKGIVYVFEYSTGSWNLLHKLRAEGLDDIAPHYGAYITCDGDFNKIQIISYETAIKRYDYDII